MKVWLKICGLSDFSGVDAALAAGADAVGFVFATSPREISIGTALTLKKHIAGRADIVAVMRHPVAAVAQDIVRQLQPDFLQTDSNDLKTITLPAGCEALPVLREGCTSGSPALPERLLFEGQQSGAGELADWQEAYRIARRAQLVLAGGLTPTNVTEAVRIVRPYGVDVSSGVESAPGEKDPELIKQFVAAVRDIESKLSHHEDDFS